jgi:hypothetical protein
MYFHFLLLYLTLKYVVVIIRIHILNAIFINPPVICKMLNRNKKIDPYLFSFFYDKTELGIVITNRLDP